jgi:nucleoside-diphosphate-sugar epimerase
MTGQPGTIYGVYKRATEQMAQRYHADEGLPSIGLRPHTIFGPGRDQGLTSAPTAAMLAAAAGRSFHIPYGGRAQYQFARDAARAFIAAAMARPTGAPVCNLAGPVVSVQDVIAAVEQAVPAARSTITAGTDELPFPESSPTDGLVETIGGLDDTPFPVAVAETVERFRTALAAGVVA